MVHKCFRYWCTVQATTVWLPSALEFPCTIFWRSEDTVGCPSTLLERYQSMLRLLYSLIVCVWYKPFSVCRQLLSAVEFLHSFQLIHTGKCNDKKRWRQSSSFSLAQPACHCNVWQFILVHTTTTCYGLDLKVENILFVDDALVNDGDGKLLPRSSKIKCSQSFTQRTLRRLFVMCVLLYSDWFWWSHLRRWAQDKDYLHAPIPQSRGHPWSGLVVPRGRVECWVYNRRDLFWRSLFCNGILGDVFLLYTCVNLMSFEQHDNLEHLALMEASLCTPFPRWMRKRADREFSNTFDRLYSCTRHLFLVWRCAGRVGLLLRVHCRLSQPVSWEVFPRYGYVYITIVTFKGADICGEGFFP